MQIMKPVTQRYSVCPTCGETDSPIDHLLNTDLNTHLYCDSCGQGYEITFKKNGDVFIRASTKRVDKTIVLLKNNEVGLIVEGMHFPDNGPLGENDSYFYNQHTCPTNYMSRVIGVVDLSNRNTDPHGIFEYVTTLEWVEDVDECNFDLADIVEQFNPIYPR